MNVLQHTRNERNPCLNQNRPDRSYRDTLKTVKKLLQKQKVQQSPSCFPDSTSLADAFNNFFISKIDKIHNAFTERAPENDLSSSHTIDRPLCDVQIHNFPQVTLDMVKKFAVKTLTKSCDFDPLLASVHPTYTNLDYKHVPQEWCDAIFFEICCIKTASQEIRC